VIPDDVLVTRPDAEERSAREVAFSRVALGLKSGLTATVVMTLFRMPISQSPPPTANFWASYVAGGTAEDHTIVGMVLHLAYGVGAGLLFFALVPLRSPGLATGNELKSVLQGLVYGLILSAFGSTVLLEGLLRMDLDQDERLVFHLSHVIYGLTIGGWYAFLADES
jgi:hypothetical protein